MPAATPSSSSCKARSYSSGVGRRRGSERAGPSAPLAPAPCHSDSLPPCVTIAWVEHDVDNGHPKHYYTEAPPPLLCSTSRYAHVYRRPPPLAAALLHRARAPLARARPRHRSRGLLPPPPPLCVSAPLKLHPSFITVTGMCSPPLQVVDVNDEQPQQRLHPPTPPSLLRTSAAPPLAPSPAVPSSSSSTSTSPIPSTSTSPTPSPSTPFRPPPDKKQKQKASFTPALCTPTTPSLRRRRGKRGRAGGRCARRGRRLSR